ncbi:hypothetical protein F3Y22_tig00110987pilonHSYRG00015 [Hibiscus syriacus]|uniref:Myosin motor domain-containing protein n=2 Tax=Hibiscus syriacus TaxID=106335 RepID=A0A6A2ZA70_HIBSY|nr:hypothetical protein F3Y22_tig00110987pilonHSYRG00015 [Hibiscus syriacus]
MEMGSGSLTESGGSATNSSAESLNEFNTGKKISFFAAASTTAIMGTSSKSGEGSSSSSGSERLNLKTTNEYNYLGQSECLVINGVNDAQKFQKLTEAMNIVQICKEEQEQAFAMLAVVLWLGNISFQVIDKENHVEASADEALTSATSLMGFAPDELMQAVSTHRIRVGRDIICKKLTLQQAQLAQLFALGGCIGFGGWPTSMGLPQWVHVGGALSRASSWWICTIC